MKRILPYILVCFALLYLFTGCSSRQIERGRWKDGVYYNDYGKFKIVTNSYFTIYSDKQIKKDLGAVYQSDTILNDMVISSDYCAVIITIEKPAGEHTQSEYVEQFILNTQTNSVNGTYAMAETFNEKIAGKDYTCVPVKYMVNASNEELAYYEYDFICKVENGVFVIIRITAGNEADIAAPLGMFKEF